jgi:hypothetical protein
VQENKERGLHVNPAVRKTTFLSHLYIKTNTLPRQARDKHRESTQNRCRFSQGTVAFNNYRIGDQQLRAYAEGLRRLGDQVRHSPLFCFSGPLDSNRPDGNRCFIKTGSGRHRTQHGAERKEKSLINTLVCVCRLHTGGLYPEAGAGE